MGFWPVVKKVVKDSDIVLEILDARMPEMSRNNALEDMVKRHKKHLILVFTKKDLISHDYIQSLKKDYPDAYFVSGSKNLGMSKLKRGILILAKRLKISKPRIAVVGYPNMGKSAVINAIAKRTPTKVSRVAGTTRGIQWIKAGSLLILDSPGVVPFEASELKLGVIGAKNPEKLKRPDKVAFSIIKNFIDRNKKALEDFYGIKAEGDEYDVLLAIGEKRKFLIKGGEIDENRTVLQIIRDWQKGNLRI